MDDDVGEMPDNPRTEKPHGSLLNRGIDSPIDLAGGVGRPNRQPCPRQALRDGHAWPVPALERLLWKACVWPADNTPVQLQRHQLLMRIIDVAPEYMGSFEL